MNLRSSATTLCSVNVGSFIEVRSDDPSAKPWLAHVISKKNSNTTGELDEIECEWLWHPKDTIQELNLKDLDANVYGSREVFLGGPSSEKDWNPVESIKWIIYVFPLPLYKKIAANGFQMSVNGTGSAILEPNRCWYYRQTIDPETRNVTPKLENIIHRPNILFHEWCDNNGVSRQEPSPSTAPSRTIMVPENPERIYYFCITCERKFETKLGDSIDVDSVHDSKHYRLKVHINASDIEFVCPQCEHINNKTTENSPAAKRTRPSNDKVVTRSQSAAIPTLGKLFDSDNCDDEVKKEEKKKQSRYERFTQIFKHAIDESTFDSQSVLLQYSDPNILCDEFFKEFENYASENKLNAKMAHQKLHELFQNIKRENSTELRRRIITGEFSLHDLVRSNAIDLAPDSLRKRREAEAKKYFTQQVLIQSNVSSQLIRKTHKGLEAISDDDIIVRSPLLNHSPLDERDNVTDNNQDVNYTNINEPSTGTTSFISDKILNNFIKETIDSRELSNADKEFATLPFHLQKEWNNVSGILEKDPQIIMPTKLFNIPNKNMTVSYLKSKLENVSCSEKLLSDLNNYCSLKEYQ